MFIATLIASDTLQAGDISAAADRLAGAGVENGGSGWIEQDIACDLRFAGDPVAARSALEGAFAGVDIIVQRAADRRRG